MSKAPVPEVPPLPSSPAQKPAELTASGVVMYQWFQRTREGGHAEGGEGGVCTWGGRWKEDWARQSR